MNRRLGTVASAFAILVLATGAIAADKLIVGVRCRARSSASPTAPAPTWPNPCDRRSSAI